LRSHRRAAIWENGYNAGETPLHRRDSSRLASDRETPLRTPNGTGRRSVVASQAVALSLRLLRGHPQAVGPRCLYCAPIEIFPRSGNYADLRRIP
jgi:hypothetical protein